MSNFSFYIKSTDYCCKRWYQEGNVLNLKAWIQVRILGRPLCNTHTDIEPKYRNESIFF